MTMSYGIVILLLLKISNISKGKTKLIKFPNLWILPVLFMGMMLEDYGKQNFVYSSEMMMALTVFGLAGLCVGLIRGGFKPSYLYFGYLREMGPEIYRGCKQRYNRSRSYEFCLWIVDWKMQLYFLSVSFFWKFVNIIKLGSLTVIHSSAIMRL